MTAAFIRLDPRDNVVVCCRTVHAGEAMTIDDVALVAAQEVGLGHKLALAPLAIGDKILKYGMPIGSMTAPAAPGDWIHLHNMKSDYMSAHTRAATGDAA